MNVNGFTEFELRTRDKIRDLITAGGEANCQRARDMRSKFLAHKTRGRFRRSLLQTVRFMVSVANGHNTHPPRGSQTPPESL